MDRQHYHTMRDACRILGIAFKTLKSLLDAGRIPVNQTLGHRKTPIFTKIDLQQIAALLQSSK